MVRKLRGGFKMIFRAVIPFNLMQDREAKLWNAENISIQEFTFTFKDLLGHYSEINGEIIFLKPQFHVREFIIPWLQNNNIPEVIDE